LHPVKINQIKQEIRVLGLEIIPFEVGYWVIGVVSRGGLSIDGVLSAKTEFNTPTECISSMITESPHFNQIRIITYDNLTDSDVEINFLSIFEKTGKPVIVLGGEWDVFHPLIENFSWKSHKVLSIGIAASSAERILDIATVHGITPEPLRVAQLIGLNAGNDL
jgi:endonuclease V-like protein UPF0215 family